MLIRRSCLLMQRDSGTPLPCEITQLLIWIVADFIVNLNIDCVLLGKRATASRATADAGKPGGMDVTRPSVLARTAPHSILIPLNSRGTMWDTFFCGAMTVLFQTMQTH